MFKSYEENVPGVWVGGTDQIIGVNKLEFHATEVLPISYFTSNPNYANASIIPGTSMIPPSGYTLLPLNDPTKLDFNPRAVKTSAYNPSEVTIAAYTAPAPTPTPTTYKGAWDTSGTDYVFWRADRESSVSQSPDQPPAGYTLAPAGSYSIPMAQLNKTSAFTIKSNELPTETLVYDFTKDLPGTSDYFKAGQGALKSSIEAYNSGVASINLRAGLLDLNKSTPDIELTKENYDILKKDMEGLLTLRAGSESILKTTQSAYAMEQSEIARQQAQLEIQRQQEQLAKDNAARIAAAEKNTFLDMTTAMNEARIEAQKAHDSDLLTLPDLGPIDDFWNPLISDIKYGGTLLTEGVKTEVGKIAEDLTYATTGDKPLSLGVGEAGRIVGSTLTLVSPTTSWIAIPAGIAASKSNEELATNIAFAGLLGAGERIVSKIEGVVAPVVAENLIMKPVVSTTFSAVKAAPTLYYGGQTLLAGGEAISLASAGDTEGAKEIDRQLTTALATAKPGMYLGGLAVDVATGVPKVAIQTAMEIQKGGLSSLMEPVVQERITSAPSFSILDITAPKYSFKESVATPAQLAALETGTPVPLPQLKGIDTLIKEAETGKAATFAKETFTSAFESDKPIVYRSSEYSLPKKPGVFAYEERGVYTSPELSTIGMKGVKSLGEESRSEFSLFPKKDLGGKALIIQPEGISKLPTSATYSTITPKEIVKLREYTGLDLSKYGEAKYDVIQRGQPVIKAGESILGTEISKVVEGKGRPLKGRNIQMSLTGEKFVTKLAPEIEAGFTEVRTKAGTVTPSVPYTLGRGGESEFLAYPAEGSYFERVEIAPRGKIRTALNRPEAFFIVDNKGYPIEGYKLKSSVIEPAKIDVKTIKEVTEARMKDLKLYEEIAKERATRGTRVNYVPLISPRIATNIRGITPSRISSTPTVQDLYTTPISTQSYSMPKIISTSTSNISSYTSPVRDIISYTEPTKVSSISRVSDVVSYPEPSRVSYTAPVSEIISYPEISYQKTTVPIREIVTYSESTIPEVTYPVSTVPISDVISYPEPTKPEITTPISDIISRPEITYPITTVPISDVITYPEPTRPVTTTPSRRIITTPTTTTPVTRITTTTPPSRPPTRPPTTPPITRYTNTRGGPLYGNVKSYNVYVRKGIEPETGAKRKVAETLVEKNLPYNMALTKGLDIAAKYAQRTAILKPSNQAAKFMDSDPVSKDLFNQFRSLKPKSKIRTGKNDLIFVEKSKYAINTKEEREGIPYKAAKMRKEGLLKTPKSGIFAPAKKSKNNNFWRMRL